MMASQINDANSPPMELAQRTDADLLSSFLRTRDADSFTELVQRHHGMVFGVANRMLGCPHIAEDVVQATFLVLAKNARKIRKSGSLSSWLYGVAFRISARSAQQRARSNTLTLKDEVMVTADPLEKLTAQFEQNTVFEELHQLPETLRTPMVLRYLKGKSNLEVAEEMSLSESAVEGRLKRGRNHLRVRLARQGVTFSAAAFLLNAIQQEASANAMPDLIAQTVATSLSGAGLPGVEAVTNQQAIYLAEQEILKMTISKVFHGSLAATFAVSIAAVGWGLGGGGSLVFAQGEDPFGDSQNSNVAEVVVNAQPPATQPSASTQFTAARTNHASNRVTSTDAERLRKLGHHSVDKLSVNEIQILEAMQQPISLQFDDVPVGEAMSTIKAHHNIPILFDKTALEQETIDPSSDAISIDVSNITLRNALQLSLSQLRLRAVPTNEVLLITSEEQAEKLLVTRIYKLDPEWELTEQQLVDAIQATAEPSSWEEVGGPGSMTIVHGGLVTSNTSGAHHAINKLLGQFDALYKDNATTKTESTIGKLK